MINIYNTSSDCQDVSNNDLTEKPNIYQLTNDFLKECTDFVVNINNSEKSPWSNDSIVRWAKVEQKIPLSTHQEHIVRFLQHKYFQNNQPCFAKQSFIATRLNLHRTQVNRSLLALEKKGLIVRIMWLYKGRRKSSIILPLVPEIKDLFNPKKCSLQRDFQKRYIKCNDLFCKSSKSNDIPNSFILYTNILYINNILINKYMAKAIGVSEETRLATSKKMVQSKANEPLIDTSINKPKQKPLNGGINKVCKLSDRLKHKIIDSKNEGALTMVEKFLLKRKERSNRPHVHQPIFDKLKFRSNYEFDKLDTGEQVDLNSYVDYFYGIDIRKHFKISKNKSNYYTQHAHELRQQLMCLVANKDDLQWDYADKVIAYWNALNIKDKRFQRLRLNNKQTKTYKNAVIAISHCLIHRAGSRMNALFEILDRLLIADKNRKAPFTWHSGISIDKFFTKIASSSDHLKIYLESDLEFERYMHSHKVSLKHQERVDTAFKYFKQLFIEQFYTDNAEWGEALCYRFEYRIKWWLENRISEIIDYKDKGTQRNMEGYSLILDNAENGNPPLLQRYFYYIRKSFMEVNGRIPKLIDIVDINPANNGLWKDFIVNHMRVEVGLPNFYTFYKN